MEEKNNFIHEITMTYKCKYNGEIQEDTFKSKESSWINFKWINIEELSKYEIHPNKVLLMLNRKNSINHIVEEKILN